MLSTCPRGRGVGAADWARHLAGLSAHPWLLIPIVVKTMNYSSRHRTFIYSHELTHILTQWRTEWSRAHALTISWASFGGKASSMPCRKIVIRSQWWLLTQILVTRPNELERACCNGCEHRSICQNQSGWYDKPIRLVCQTSMAGKSS